MRRLAPKSEPYPLPKPETQKPFPDPKLERECPRKERETNQRPTGNEAMVAEMGCAKGSWRPLSNLRRIQPCVVPRIEKGGRRWCSATQHVIDEEMIKADRGEGARQNNDSNKAQHELDLTRPNLMMLKLTLKSGLLA